MAQIDYQYAGKDNPYFCNEAGRVEFTIGTEAADVIRVTAALKRPRVGLGVGKRLAVVAYLSTDAEGDNITSSAPDGGVVVGNKGVVIPLVAGKAFQLITNASGEVNIDITESTAKTFYLIIVLPTGETVASGAITFAA